MLQYIWQQLAEINKGLGDIKQCLGRVEASVDANRVAVEKLDVKHDSLHGQVVAVEKKMSWAIGAAVAGTAVISVALAVVGYFANKAIDLAIQERVASTAAAAQKAPPEQTTPVAGQKTKP